MWAPGTATIGNMRGLIPVLSPILLSALVAAACGPQMTAAPASPTAPATATSTTSPAPTSAASTAAPSAAAESADAPKPTTAPSPPASAVECTKDEACGGADAGPPPLRAGKGVADPFATGTSHTAAKTAAPCTKDTLKQQLQKIVDACRKNSRSICGDVVLHTVAGDAGNDNVSVDFNLGTSGDTTGFSKCVVGRINTVTWACAMQGQDVHLDLGCRL